MRAELFCRQERNSTQLELILSRLKLKLFGFSCLVLLETMGGPILCSLGYTARQPLYHLLHCLHMNIKFNYLGIFFFFWKTQFIGESPTSVQLCLSAVSLSFPECFSKVFLFFVIKLETYSPSLHFFIYLFVFHLILPTTVFIQGSSQQIVCLSVTPTPASSSITLAAPCNSWKPNTH